MNYKPLRILRYLLFTFILISTLPIALIKSQSGGRHHCSVCALEMYAAEWFFPLTEWSIYRTERFDSTLLNDLLSRKDFIPEHQHQWLFDGGVVRGSRVCGGPGMNLAIFANGTETVPFIRHLLEEGDARTTHHWLRIGLNPQGARILSRYLNGSDRGFPQDGFPEQSKFREWWSVHRPVIEAQLREEGMSAANPLEVHQLQTLTPKFFYRMR